VATVWYLDTKSWGGGSWIKYKEVSSAQAEDVFASVFIQDELIHRILSLCRTYLDRQDRDTSSILGFLLHGKPGQGKSFFLQMLAIHLKMDLCYLPLASGDFDDASLIKAFANAPSNSIFLMEDVDNVEAALAKGELERKVGGQRQVEKHITASTLLNILSGPLCKGGLVFGTTNYPEKLLPSLTRSGRLGNLFEFGNPDDKSILKAAHYFFPTLDGPGGVAFVDKVRALEAEERRREAEDGDETGSRGPALEREIEAQDRSVRSGHRVERAQPFTCFSMATISGLLREEMNRNTKPASHAIDRVLASLQSMLRGAVLAMS
jgi:SpoVK/Ycf46/Vps4 family AAA+-type ATPase